MPFRVVLPARLRLDKGTASLQCALEAIRCAAGLDEVLVNCGVSSHNPHHPPLVFGFGFGLLPDTGEQLAVCGISFRRLTLLQSLSCTQFPPCTQCPVPCAQCPAQVVARGKFEGKGSPGQTKGEGRAALLSETN